MALRKRVKWEIIINEKKALVRCDCGYSGEPNILKREKEYTLFECPKCRSIPRIVEGDDILLKEVF